MGSWIGYSIIGASILIVLGMSLVGILSFRSKSPSEYYRTVGYRYLQGAVQPWAGMGEAVDTIYEALSELFPSHVQKLTSFWIDIVPYEGYCRGALSPGIVTVQDSSGARHVSRVNGTVDIRRCLGLGKKHYVLVIRQLRKGDSVEESLQATGKGELRSVGDSALFHEVAHHLVPHILGQGWNASHSMKWSAELTKKMHLLYSEKTKSDGRPS